MMRTRSALMFGLLSLLAASSSAQPSKKGAEDPIPPTISKLEPAGIIIPYMLAFLLIGAVVGISAIPSKRGHQD
jgi:hypothetical protein